MFSLSALSYVNHNYSLHAISTKRCGSNGALMSTRLIKAYLGWWPEKLGFWAVVHLISWYFVLAYSAAILKARQSSILYTMCYLPSLDLIGILFLILCHTSPSCLTFKNFTWYSSNCLTFISVFKVFWPRAQWKSRYSEWLFSDSMVRFNYCHLDFL